MQIAECLWKDGQLNIAPGDTTTSRGRGARGTTESSFDTVGTGGYRVYMLSTQTGESPTAPLNTMQASTH